MKIVLVGPVHPLRGGIAHYTALLARALTAQGHTVLVVSFRRLYPRWLYPGDSDRDPSAQPWRVEAEYLLDTLWPPSWWQAAARIRRFGPDLVVLQWWTTFLAPAWWVLARGLRRAGLRVAFLIHNVLPHEPRRGDAVLTRRVLGQGQAFLVQTEAERGRLAALLPQARAVVATLPVFGGFADSAVPRADARRRLGLPAAAGVILFFGIVRPYKGLGVLLEALAQLHRAGQPAHLLVAGEFWEDRRGYEQTIKRLGLGAFVRLTGRYVPNEEVGLYFSAADVFAAPYVGGTQSAAVKVALAFGLPVVTTRAADVAGQPGHRVVAPGDAAALADALHAMLQSSPPPPRLMPNADAGWDALAAAVAGLRGA